MLRVCLLIVMPLSLSCGEVIVDSNEIAQLDDGEVCFAENYDRLAKGWSDKMLHQWCDTGELPGTWYDRMVRDKCAACPDCCTRILETNDEQEDN